MRHSERLHTSSEASQRAYSINGLSPSARIRVGHSLVSAGDIAAGMKIVMEDGKQATVLSACTYWTDAQRVNVSTKYGDMSLCLDAHLSCVHPMCELYFGCSEVAYPIKAMVGYDPAFSWQPSTELSECVSFELDQIGWFQIHYLSVFIPHVSVRSKDERRYSTASGIKAQYSSSLHSKLVLSPEETVVLSTFGCALTGVLPVQSAKGVSFERQLGHAQ